MSLRKRSLYEIEIEAGKDDIELIHTGCQNDVRARFIIKVVNKKDKKRTIYFKKYL